jgi:hypothetical protein
MFGSDDAEKKRQEERERERQHRLHNNNLKGAAAPDNGKAEILKQLSEIDDLPIDGDDPVMGQLTSQLASTANLNGEDIRSKEWVFEYLKLLYLANYPPEYGITGDRRAFVYDDPQEYREPLDEEDQSMVEAYLDNAKRTLTRSEDAKVIEEATRTINESVVRDESDDSGSSGGILGRMGIR